MSKIMEACAMGHKTEPRDNELGERIKTLAYLKWELAGKPDGKHQEFWLEAEQEVISQGQGRLMPVKKTRKPRLTKTKAGV